MSETVPELHVALHLSRVMSADWRAWLWKTLGEQFNVPALSDCVLLVEGISCEFVLPSAGMSCDFVLM